MRKEFIVTADGSTTIHLPEWNESYHSKHGAIQEAYHVFIKNGLSYFRSQPVSILEIGFGTGLNALITMIESERNGQKISYTGVEAFPISAEDAVSLNYSDQLKSDPQLFKMLHESGWNDKIDCSDDFVLTKLKLKFEDITEKKTFDLIYFDAFGFQVQPELWSEVIFQAMYDALKEKGLLVTYAARTVIKKNMELAGFSVKKIPGPPGKREMLQAFKGDWKN